MRLLLFNLATDADDPVLGFTTLWISALAQRCEFIDVVTMRAGRLDLPANVRVHSVGKEKGYGKPRRVAEFYKILARIIREQRVDACFSHMMPLFSALAGPLLKVHGIPIVTWYAHAKVTPILKIAHRFSARMVASVSTAYPYRHDKFSVIGHGIDVGLFSPAIGELPVGPPILLCAGRLSPVKDHPTLIGAVAWLRQRWTGAFRVIILGSAATPRDQVYVQSLHRQVENLGLGDIVSFEPAVALQQLPAWYRRASVYVNMTAGGSGDKVVWEAMGCAVLSIVANQGFNDTLGIYADRCVYDYGDARQLADRLKWALALPQSDRASIGLYLRSQVEAQHSLPRLVHNLMSVLDTAMLPRRSAVKAEMAKLG